MGPTSSKSMPVTASTSLLTTAPIQHQAQYLRLRACEMPRPSTHSFPSTPQDASENDNKCRAHKCHGQMTQVVSAEQYGGSNAFLLATKGCVDAQQPVVLLGVGPLQVSGSEHMLVQSAKRSTASTRTSRSVQR